MAGGDGLSSYVKDSRWKKSKIASHTFTKSFSLYSSHLTLSELNKIVYDVTHWAECGEGLPCVASFVTSLSSPRSVCNHWPASFDAADQEPQNMPTGTLFRRASQDSCPGSGHTEEAVMAEFGKRLFSIPSAWILHSVKWSKQKYNIIFANTRSTNYISLTPLWNPFLNKLI